MKRAYMECGGKSPNLVFADAPDLKRAAEAAASGIFFNQGEVCTAASRLLVERSIKDEFVAMVVEAGRSYQPRHPLDPGAMIGAMVDEDQTRRVLGYIEKGQAEGAKPLPAAMIVVGWLFLLAWRGLPSFQALHNLSYNGSQVLLMGLTAVTLGILIFAVGEGLLGSPEMFITGNGSTRTALRWYLDRSGPLLPIPAGWSRTFASRNVARPGGAPA